MAQTVNPALLQLLQNQALPVTQGPAALMSGRSHPQSGGNMMGGAGMGGTSAAVPSAGASSPGLMQSLAGGVQQGVGLAQLLSQMGMGGGRDAQGYKDLAANTQSPIAGLAAAEQGMQMEGGAGPLNLLYLLGLGG